MINFLHSLQRVCKTDEFAPSSVLMVPFVIAASIGYDHGCDPVGWREQPIGRSRDHSIVHE